MKLKLLGIPLMLGLGMAVIWLLANQPAQAAKLPQSIGVTTINDEFGTGTDCSLREAIQAVNTEANFGGCVYDDSHTVILPTGTYTLSLAGDNENENETGDLDIQAAMTIQGYGADVTHVSADSLDRVFDIRSGLAQVAISGISISDGNPGMAPGGGVYIEESAVDFTDLIIFDNTSIEGAGVYASDSLITISNVTIATNGGGIYGGGLSIASSQLVLDDILIAENDASFGGGIYAVYSTTITMSAVTIEDNIGDESGGGIYLSDSTALLESGEIRMNSGEPYGGGVYITGEAAIFHIAGGEISQNVATSGGGGIFVNGGQVVMSAGSILNNTAIQGGGVFVDNGADFLLEGGQIISNTYTTTGGGVYLRGDSSTFTLIGEALIANNSAPENGGGIYVQSGTLFINGGEIRDNYASNRGGGIYIDDGRASINGGVIHNNDAMEGGGMAVVEGQAILTYTQILSNTALRGGGIYDGSDPSIALTLTEVVISGNTAYSEGGGVYAAAGGLLLRKCRIVNNESTHEGGGIRLGSSVKTANPDEVLLMPLATGFRMVGGLVSGNTSGSEGGGIYLEGFDNVVFERVAIVGNTAATIGGGINSQDPIVLKNVTISHNHAAQGGGVATSNDPMVIEYSTIASNTSNIIGGLYRSGGALHIWNSIVANNANANCSGGIISDGFNLDSGVTCDFDQPSDQQNIDPVLGSLANNGGNTLTHALLHGSPAIDAGACEVETRVDQRGRPRPNLGSSFCDIGAFEANVGGLVDLELTKTVTPASAAPGVAITYTLAYTNTGPSGAVKVSIKDIIPAGVTMVNITNTGATITPIPGIFYAWMIEDLQPRSGGTIFISAVLDIPLAAGEITNTGTITSSAVDTEPTDNAGSVVFTVLPVAPVAKNNSYTTAEDTPLNVVIPGVLGNDTDANGDSLTAMLDASPLHGTLALAVDGSFSYTPGTDYVGADTFTYHASDGALDSNTATVTITVGADNDPPTAVADAYTTDEDVQLGVAAPGVLDNDSDPEGDTLMAVLDAGPAHGALTLNMDGAFSYTPELDYTGEDTFTYHASDGSLDSAAAMVTIQVNAVNDAPQAKDDSYTTNDDTPLNVIAPGVLFNDNDPENDALSAVLYTSTGYGELILSADGSFSYTPDPGYVGDDTFSYRASDGSLESAAATVTIHVGVANDSPQAVADSYSTDQDAELNISAPGLLANDSDPNGDNLMAFLDTAPLNGSLVLNANGSFSYTPSLGFTGEDTFSYHASDGSLSSEVVSVTIVVEATGYCLYLPVVKKP